MRKALPASIVVVSAAIIILNVCFQMPEAFKDMAQELDKWSVLSTAMVCFLGLVNLTRVHTSNIRRKGKHWDISILLLAVTYAMLVLGIFTGPKGKTYDWVFQTTVVPLGASFYAIVAFYAFSAGYRCFTMRSRDAMILLITGIVVLVGMAPLGEKLIPQTTPLTNWILEVPSAAASRGISFGAGIAGLITTCRIILGLDRPYLGAGE
ncbi:MAG: hypothetical protein ACOX3V_05295 [Bacillota bacterium]|jgi:hypothetical protein